MLSAASRPGSHGSAGSRVACQPPTIWRRSPRFSAPEPVLTQRAAVGALVLFNVVAFASAEIPMVSFLIAPETTRTSLDDLYDLYDWMHAHRRLSVAVLAGVVGIYLLAVGISKL